MDLNTLLPAEAGWILTHANAINNQGQIVGCGEFGEARHAFLLTPIEASGGNGPTSQLLGRSPKTHKKWGLLLQALTVVHKVVQNEP